MNNTDRKIETWQKMGWCPVKYAHHPKPIKDAIRQIGMRPQMKQCFANCQRFTIQVDWLDFEYHEGWCVSIIPFTHAWLKWNGQIIDLTLEPDHDKKYMDSIVYAPDQIRRNMLRTCCYSPIDERALAEIGPHADLLRKQGIL